MVINVVEEMENKDEFIKNLKEFINIVLRVWKKGKGKDVDS